MAARNMDLLNWIGMETNEEYGEIVSQGGDTIRIIKPFADHHKILDENQVCGRSWSCSRWNRYRSYCWPKTVNTM